MFMTTTPVSTKILAEADEQAKQILAEADEQVQQIQDQAQKEFDAMSRQIQDDVDQAAQQEQNRILAAARQTVTTELLRAKHQILDEVRAAAGKSLTDMPTEQYRKFLLDLLKQATFSTNQTVLPAEGEKNIDQKLLDQANQQSDKTTLKLSTDKVPGSGGFLISAGKISTNVTWETLLTQARRELEPQLSKLLFPNTEQ